MKKLTVSVILFFTFITQSMANVECTSKDGDMWVPFSLFEKKEGRKAVFYYLKSETFTYEMRVLTNGNAELKTIYNGRYLNGTIHYECSHTSLEIL